MGENCALYDKLIMVCFSFEKSLDILPKCSKCNFLTERRYLVKAIGHGRHVLTKTVTIHLQVEKKKERLSVLLMIKWIG